MVRTWHFCCCGLSFIPGQGTKILQATWSGQKIYIYIFKNCHPQHVNSRESVLVDTVCLIHWGLTSVCAWHPVGAQAEHVVQRVDPGAWGPGLDSCLQLTHLCVSYTLGPSSQTRGQAESLSMQMYWMVPGRQGTLCKNSLLLLYHYFQLIDYKPSSSFV